MRAYVQKHRSMRWKGEQYTCNFNSANVHGTVATMDAQFFICMSEHINQIDTIAAVDV